MACEASTWSHFWLVWRQFGTHLAEILGHGQGLCCAGSVTNNCTWVRIGYRIYSLWRFITAHITILMNTIALVASQIPLTELYWANVSLRGLTDKHFLTHWRGLTPTSDTSCHVYHGCVIVWLNTLCGFGLVTGFIHYGDLQLHTLQLLTADTTIHTEYRLSDLARLITATFANRWLLTAEHWLTLKTNWQRLMHWFRTLTHALTHSDSKDWLLPLPKTN
jgi:hypothetical protein